MKVYKDTEEYSKAVEKAFCDILDGVVHWQEIARMTGLSQERCEELLNFYREISDV